MDLPLFGTIGLQRILRVELISLNVDNGEGLVEDEPPAISRIFAETVGEIEGSIKRVGNKKKVANELGLVDKDKDGDTERGGTLEGERECVLG